MHLIEFVDKVGRGGYMKWICFEDGWMDRATDRFLGGIDGEGYVSRMDRWMDEGIDRAN